MEDGDNVMHEIGRPVGYQLCDVVERNHNWSDSWVDYVSKLELLCRDKDQNVSSSGEIVFWSVWEEFGLSLDISDDLNTNKKQMLQVEESFFVKLWIVTK